LHNTGWSGGNPPPLSSGAVWSLPQRRCTGLGPGNRPQGKGDILPPSAIYFETTIHPDGSCDRMNWQPKEKFLPDHALKPEWNARRKSVSDARGGPGKSGARTSNDDCQYFIACGSFNSPREITLHFHVADKDVPDAGASELERRSERNDYGFVIEHRWKERITNIVTLPAFVRARDELLDLFLPLYTDAIEKDIR
jgi:hypothetical protein